jgi:hypothetical protein
VAQEVLIQDWFNGQFEAGMTLLQESASAGQINFATINNDSSFEAQVQFQNNPHLVVTNAGSSSLEPSISACGSGAALARAASVNLDTDTSAVVTVGTGTITACTITFAKPYRFGGDPTHSYPACVVTTYDNSTPITASISAISNTALTFAFSANMASKRFAYWCPQ